MVNIPKSQLAAVSSGPGSIAIKQVPVMQPDELPAGRALVKLEYSGVCHTDIHLINGDWPLKVSYPCIAGHEGIGKIVAINDTTSALKVGQTVGIKWIAHACGTCDFCLAGEGQICQDVVISSTSDIGTYQQYCPAYVSELVPVPDGADLPAMAPILCAGVTVYRALKQSRARSGQSIVIFGAGGGLGSLAIQYARYMGLSVVAVDTGSDKKQLCLELGAARWVDFKGSEDVYAAIRAATPDGLGPHAAMVVAPIAAAYANALALIRPGGVVVAVGLPGDNAAVTSDVFEMVTQMKTVTGSYVGNRLDAVEAVRIAAEGHVKSPYKVQPFDTLPHVLETKLAGVAGRIVVDLR